ncbi:unnamed protein product [Ambrosiozyma monospora]|uniref:Unnamed protein product n=1 Tax=Ambrosiozyma monospora TaxID=43982 RepID=A0ACB5TB69_AMBMO|nr:unnamed protein product [Ambrosiozyma monospora]
MSTIRVHSDDEPSDQFNGMDENEIRNLARELTHASREATGYVPPAQDVPDSQYPPSNQQASSTNQAPIRDSSQREPSSTVPIQDSSRAGNSAAAVPGQRDTPTVDQSGRPSQLNQPSTQPQSSAATGQSRQPEPVDNRPYLNQQEGTSTAPYRQEPTNNVQAQSTMNTIRKSLSSLSRHSTRISQLPASGDPPFNSDDKRLDPDSDEFNAKYWIKNMRVMRDKDVDYYKPYKLGVVYKDLRAFGSGADADFKDNCINFPIKWFNTVKNMVNVNLNQTDILHPMDALMRPGTLNVVLGRPGAGCTTLLKCIASQTHGFHVDEKTRISYDGLTPHDIENHYRGDVIYDAEVETHFPHLTVGQTLELASSMKVPQNRPAGIDRDTYSKHLAKVAMALFGLSHTYYTKVGDDFVRGVSGGERKRVSIAEVTLSGGKLECWDNSTRGLDSASAENFVKTLKMSSEVLDTTGVVSIYQCSQGIF